MILIIARSKLAIQSLLDPSIPECYHYSMPSCNPNGSITPKSLYIHIPFCATLCYYCDFNTYTFRKKLSENYLIAIEKEMKLYSTDTANRPDLDTVFIGGGTPSILSSYDLEILFNLLHQYFQLTDDTELTVECNPGTVDKQKLTAMQSFGVNRLSFGVQAMQDVVLERIGRIHTVESVYDSYDLARKIGFDNINLDLIFALPGQTMKQWQESVQEVIKLSPEHISSYNLTLEHGTPFYDQWKQGNLKLVDNELEAKMYQLCIDHLASAGYQHYEISNFAQSGREAKHNLVYWYNEAYFGLGAGACGYINEYRYTNIKGIKEYILAVDRGKPIANQERLKEQQRKAETIMLGLRKLAGIDQDLYQSQFGESIQTEFGSIIERFQNLGLLHWSNNRLQLTTEGLMMADAVFVEFI